MSRLLIVYVAAASMLAGVCLSEEMKCYAAEEQAGSASGSPCIGKRYKTSLCALSESEAKYTGALMKGVLDSMMNPESCRPVIDPFCKAIQPEASVKPDANCDLMCDMFAAGSIKLCKGDSDCARSQYTGDASQWGGDIIAGLASSSISDMCCSWMEQQLRLVCTGFDEAKLVAHVDGSVSTVCSIKPDCLTLSSASGLGSSMSLVALLSAASYLLAYSAW